MTKQEFTRQIALNDKQFGILSIGANIALEENKIDLHVQHWIDQYINEDSRSQAIKILGDELTQALVKIINENNE